MSYSKLIDIPLSLPSDRVAIAASKILHQIKDLDPQFKTELRSGTTDNWQLDASNNFSLHLNDDGYYLFSKYNETDVVDRVVLILEEEFIAIYRQKIADQMGVPIDDVKCELIDGILNVYYKPPQIVDSIDLNFVYPDSETHDDTNNQE